MPVHEHSQFKINRTDSNNIRDIIDKEIGTQQITIIRKLIQIFVYYF